jgi:hypothetical protein
LNAGGITVTIQGGNSDTGSAREIARKILPEMQSLMQRTRKAA